MFIFLFPVSAKAETNAGIGPDSFFYFFDITAEKINLFFTFNPESKALKALEYADERLAEAKESANKNDTEAIEKAMENYKEKISLATEKSKEIEDEEKIEELLNIVAESTAKHQEILNEVLEKVSDEAKEAILKAIEISKRGQEEANKQISDLKKEVSELKQELEEVKEKLENKNGESKENDNDKEIGKLKKEIEELKQEAKQPKSQGLETEDKEKVSENRQPELFNATPPATTLCNGRYWNQCPTGQKFYCPATGDAKCLAEDKASNLVIENPQIKIEKCKAERDSGRVKMMEESRKLVEEGLREFQDQLLQLVYERYPAGATTASDIMDTFVTPQIKAKREKDMQTMTTGVDKYLNDEYIKCLNK